MPTTNFMTRYYLKKILIFKSLLSFRSLKNIFLLLGFFPLIIIAVSCEEGATTIGKNILPGSDFVSLKTIDTLSARSFTQFDDSIRTDNPSNSYLGRLDDSYFGSTAGELVSQVRLSNEWDGSQTYTVDSVKLILKFLTTKGTVSTDYFRTLKISEIAKQIYTDSAYYSHSPLPLTGFSVSGIRLPRTLRSDTINDVTLTVPVEFGNYIIRDTSQFFYSSTKADFRSYFKGIRIQLDAGQDPLLVSLSLTSTITTTGYYNNYFDIYMHDSAGTQQQYLLILDAVNKNAAYNRFIHDFSTADIDKKIKHINDNYRDSLSYLQCLNGVYTKIKIPGLANLKNTGDFLGKFGINKARLVVPYKIDGNLYKHTTIPTGLYLRYRTTTGHKWVVPDYSIDTYHQFFDGVADTVNNVYNFNIATFVQKYFNDKADTILPDLEVFQSLGTKNVILKANNNKTPIKFEFNYTKF